MSKKSVFKLLKLTVKQNIESEFQLSLVQPKPK